jgi:hypothetical protein
MILSIKNLLKGLSQNPLARHAAAGRSFVSTCTTGGITPPAEFCDSPAKDSRAAAPLHLAYAE